MKIEYCEKGGDWTTKKPTYRNAAEYTTYYRVTASDYLTVKGSATVKISKADQKAPTGLVGNNWTTCSSKDGSISGVTKAMEYRRGSSGDYQKITSDGKLTGLTKSGTYNVRFAEDGNHNASADTEVKIEPGPMPLPTTLPGSRMAKVATLRSASIARRLRSASPAGGNMRSLRPPRLRPMVFVKRSAGFAAAGGMKNVIPTWTLTPPPFMTSG